MKSGLLPRPIPMNHVFCALRRKFSTIRLLGDFDLAEDALHDAFRVAMEQWPRDGVPDNPRAWLVSMGRFKAIDALRRHARLDGLLDELAGRLENAAGAHRPHRGGADPGV